jgi:hypothetical protein
MIFVNSFSFIDGVKFGAIHVKIVMANKNVFHITYI